VVTVVSEGERPSTVASNRGRELMAATTALMTTTDTTAAAATTVTRFKISDIQTHCFSTFDRIC